MKFVTSGKNRASSAQNNTVTIQLQVSMLTYFFSIRKNLSNTLCQQQYQNLKIPRDLVPNKVEGSVGLKNIY